MKNDYSLFGQYLARANRRTGKTYNLCTMAKAIGATVVCRNVTMALLAKDEFGVKTLALHEVAGLNMAGKSIGNIYLDPDAAGAIILELSDRLRVSENKLEHLRECLG